MCLYIFIFSIFIVYLTPLRSGILVSCICYSIPGILVSFHTGNTLSIYLLDEWKTICFKGIFYILEMQLHWMFRHHDIKFDLKSVVFINTKERETQERKEDKREKTQ